MNKEFGMRHVLNLPVMVLILGSAAVANGATWHVIPGGGGDATTIQAGINLASNGDVVLVAPGTYTGAGNRNISFNGKNITVTSETGAQFTTIDCQNAAQAFLFQNGETASAVLEGFTIKNGYGVKGGAINCNDVSPTVRYNVFRNNTATTSGGAMYVRFGTVTVYNNTFDGNTAPAGGTIAIAGPASPQIYQNIIHDSAAGGAFSCMGNMTGTLIGCNCVHGNVGGDAICAGDAGNNFTLDPLFCGIPGSGNFFLQETSPCSSTYSPCSASVGAFGPQCQVTATEAVTWGKVKSMYR
jgi:hypothetical protein